MRIRSIDASDIPPIKRFELENTSDVIVLAGRNGIGKTRFVQALIAAFRTNRVTPNLKLIIEGTSGDETDTWGKDYLDTSNADDLRGLIASLKSNRRRRNWKSSIVQFESDRSIKRISPLAFSWDLDDPWEESISWERTFSGLSERYEDTIHSILKKVQARRNHIARTAEKLMAKGESVMDLDFADPIRSFKEVFFQLLAPKQLVDPDPKVTDLQFELEGVKYGFSALSSGEREVVNTVFDFLLRNPSDCIIFFDEPELHLHPELSFKLLQTLQMIGQRNQFIFCTHSPDIITALLDHTVVFIGPPDEGGTNQALVVREDDETNAILHRIGHSIGVMALGKRLVLIEGENTSVDKQVYGSILGNRFPDLVLVPSTGRNLITSFSTIRKQILNSAIWGVEFYMLCDRDAIDPSREASEIEGPAGGRLIVLPRYHIENYFLDPEVLALVFEDLEDEDSPLRNCDELNKQLIEIATGQVSYATALYVSTEVRAAVGNIDLMVKGCHSMNPEELAEELSRRAESELARVGTALDLNELRLIVANRHTQLTQSLSDGTWQVLLPGRPILNQFSSRVKLPIGRLRRLYLSKVAEHNSDVFNEVVAIFEGFSSMTLETS